MVRLSGSIKNEILTLIGIFSFIYPITLIIRAAFFKSEGILFNVIIDILILLTGFVILKIVGRLKQSFFKRLLPYLALAILIVIGAAAFYNSGFVRAFFEILILLLFYIIGYRIKSKYLDNFFSDGRFKFGIFLIAVSLIISFYFKHFITLKPYILVFTYIYIGVFILERNRNKLEWAFKQNGVDGSVFSTKIRSFNGKLTLLVFIIIVLLSNIKGLKLIFEYCLKLLGLAFLKINYYIALLLSLLLQKTDSNAPEKQDPQIVKFETNKPSLWDLIQDILIKAVLLYLVYKFLPVILRKLKQGFLFLIKYLKKLLTNLKQSQTENNDEYVDSMEILEMKVSRKENDNLKHKKKRTKKDFNKIDDPVERVRLIYKILIEKIQNKRVNIKTSDTTGEIYLKSMQIEGIQSSFKELTDIYDTVRYKDEVPSKDEINKAEKNYDLVCDIIKSTK
jgi:hypothetical protein